MNRTYCVHYETEYHVGFESIEYGELTSFKRMCKEQGYKITAIEYLVNGRVVDIKRF